MTVAPAAEEKAQSAVIAVTCVRKGMVQAAGVAVQLGVESAAVGVRPCVWQFDCLKVAHTVCYDA